MTIVPGNSQVTKTDGLVDQASTNTGKEDNYEKKLPVHEKKAADIAANTDDSKTPRTKSTSQGDSSSSSHKSEVVFAMKQPNNKNGAAIPAIDNSLKKRAAPTSCHYMWSMPRQYKRLCTQPDDAVTSATSIYENQMPKQCFTTSERDSSSFFSSARASLITTNLDGNHPAMKTSFGNASSPAGFCGSSSENELNEKVDNAFGATIDSNHKFRSFNIKSSDEMRGQDRISKLTDVSPRMEKIVSAPLRKPTRAMRRSATKDKSKIGRAPPNKQRNCKASVPTGHHMNGKPSNNTGEIDPDHKDLLVAVSSVHNGCDRTCGDPFWKTVESFFAPVAAEGLQLLNRQLNPIKELGQTGSQMLSDVCEAVCVPTKDATGVGNLDRESVKCTDLGGPRAEKKMNVVPPLFQRVLSALIDEDEGTESYNSNEGTTNIFQCNNDDSYKGKEKCEVESEVEFQSQKYSLLDGLSGSGSASSNISSKKSVFSTFCNDKLQQADDGLSFSTVENLPWSDQDDLNVLDSSLVNTPLMSSVNHQYQGLSVEEKLALELESIGLNCEETPLVDAGIKWIDKQIKECQSELYQQEGKVQDNLEKVKVSIQSEQASHKRSIEKSAMDQLVQMAYGRLVGKPKKYSRTRKVPKEEDLAFAGRTLARCKQFENSGESCFKGIISNKTPSEISVGPRDCNGLLMNKEAQKNVKHKDSGFMINKERQELPSKTGDSSPSKANEIISIGHPSQVDTGFSGSERSLSDPSGLNATYDFTLTKGKMEFPHDIAICAFSEANRTSKHGGIHSETVMNDGDKNGDEVTVLSASPIGKKSEPKSKQKRTLSRIGKQELAKSVGSSSIKPCCPTTNANNAPHSPPNAASQPLPGAIELDDSELAKLIDDNFLDLDTLLDFDDEGLLDDGDCAGLDVPMDNLSDIDFSFIGGLL